MRTILRAMLWAASALWRSLSWPLRIFARGRDREALVALRRPVADAGEGWALWLLIAFIVVCALLAVPSAAS